MYCPIIYQNMKMVIILSGPRFFMSLRDSIVDVSSDTLYANDPVAIDPFALRFPNRNSISGGGSILLINDSLVECDYRGTGIISWHPLGSSEPAFEFPLVVAPRQWDAVILDAFGYIILIPGKPRHAD